MENKFANSRKLALLEELKSMPFGAVYDYYCEMNNMPVSMEFMDRIEDYEKTEMVPR